MNILINPEELAAPFIKQVAVKFLQEDLQIQWLKTDAYVRECQQQYKDTGYIVIDFRTVNHLLKQDLLDFRDVINAAYKEMFRAQSNIHHQMLDKLQQQGITRQQIIAHYIKDSMLGFAKSMAPAFTSQPNWIMNTDQIDWQQPLLIRNVYHNTEVIRLCIDQQREFWFVDSGYTNFLTGKNKLWHRLVHNAMHHSYVTHYYPEDRIDLLPSLPKPWQDKGKTVLVIESSEQHYTLHGTSLAQWRRWIEYEIKSFTNRPIEFRPKQHNKKTRQSVYEYLLANPRRYYCVISDSSAAAVEAIWAGVPVITLKNHITNSVAKRDIADINDLYRGSLDQWLAMLTYSQWTFEELCDGTALTLTRQWHDV